MALQDVDWIGTVSLKVRVRLVDQDGSEVTNSDLQRLVQNQILNALNGVALPDGAIYSVVVSGEDLILWDERS